MAHLRITGHGHRGHVKRPGIRARHGTLAHSLKTSASLSRDWPLAVGGVGYRRDMASMVSRSLHRATRAVRWIGGTGLAVLGLAGAWDDARRWWSFLGTGQARVVTIILGFAMLAWAARDLAESRRANPEIKPLPMEPQNATTADDESPLGLLVRSHAGVDSELRALLRRSGADDAPSANTAQLAGLAFSRGLISAKTREATETLAVMLALPDDEEHPQAQEASKLSSLAETVRYAIRLDGSNRLTH